MVFKSIFLISKMDCPSEERMIRLKLDSNDFIKSLEFDIPNRNLTVYHTGLIGHISETINGLNLGSELLETIEASNFIKADENLEAQKKLLWIVLGINFSFFLIEILSGLFSNSVGLVADSLDMLADAMVYALSLFAVGATLNRKKLVTRISGYFQLVLAGLGFFEVIRKFSGAESTPDFKAMIIISILALVANSFCLYLLQKSKSKEIHMKASSIFTSNDVIVNIGVIVAGVLVQITNSNKPDLIIGTIIFLLVVQGALRILKLAE